jgi:hypothetical protein
MLVPVGTFDWEYVEVATPALVAELFWAFATAKRPRSVVKEVM